MTNKPLTPDGIDINKKAQDIIRQESTINKNIASMYEKLQDAKIPAGDCLSNMLTHITYILADQIGFCCNVGSKDNVDTIMKKVESVIRRRIIEASQINDK